MADFDWRPVIYLLTLAVFTLLWLVGCTILTDTGTRSAPTAYPNVTLTVGRIVETIIPADAPPPTVDHSRISTSPTDQAAGTAPLSSTPSDEAAADSSTTESPAASSSPDPVSLLHLTPPICYETQARTIRCLGRVDNSLLLPIGGVSVRVRLYQRGGDSIEAISVIEQTIIPPNTFAPYRVDFSSPWSGYAGIAVSLNSGTALTRTQYTAIPIEAAQMNTQPGIRTITADLIVPSGVKLRRVVVSLIDANGRVQGYQVIRYNDDAQITPQTIAVEAIVIPQNDVPDLSPVIHAEGQQP